MKNAQNSALITGGSSGIGLAFARELAAQKYDLVLVSRDENLHEVADDLAREFNVQVEAVEADLSNSVDLEKVAERIRDAKKPVGMLINCAGFVLRDSVVHGDLKRQKAAFDVMAWAVLVLSQTAAGVMRERNSGTIINIASTSAWFVNGNYSALKRWVVTYTQALSVELRGTGVHVTAVCPGETRTNFHARGGISHSGTPKWLWCTPEQVASQGLHASAKNKPIFVPTFKWRAIVWFLHHFQHVARNISRKMIIKRIAEVDAKNANKKS